MEKIGVRKLIGSNFRRVHKRRNIGCYAVFLLIFFTAAAFAAPQVKLTVSVEKEVLKMENGKPVVLTEPVHKTSVGDTLVYTINYVNDGDETAFQTGIVGIVPENTTYIDKSAKSVKKALTLFSIDQAKSFRQLPITYEEIAVDGSKTIKPVPPEKFTHIRWVVQEPIQPQQSGKVFYKVKVK